MRGEAPAQALPAGRRNDGEALASPATRGPCANGERVPPACPRLPLRASGSGRTRTCASLRGRAAGPEIRRSVTTAIEHQNRRLAVGIMERTARTGDGLAAGTARRRANTSKSQQCHRTRGWLGHRGVGATPVGAPKGYGNRNFPQAARTGLRLARTHTSQSCPPKHALAGARGRHVEAKTPGIHQTPQRAPTSSGARTTNRGAPGWENHRTRRRRTPDPTHDPLPRAATQSRSAMQVHGLTGADTAPAAHSPPPRGRDPQEQLHTGTTRRPHGRRPHDSTHSLNPHQRG